MSDTGKKFTGPGEDLAVFRQMFDLMPQLGWTAQPDGWIDYYNKGWYDYTGTTYEQMQGWGWESVHEPEMLPAVKEKWIKSIKTGTPFEMRFPLKRKDGSYRWFLTRINPLLDSDGRLIRWVGINTDIQEELDQQQRLEKALLAETEALRTADEARRQFTDLADSMPALVWAARPDGFTYFHNKTFCQYTGLTPEELKGSGWQQNVHPEDIAQTLSKWETSAASDSRFSAEYRLRASDGSYRWFFAEAVPIRNTTGSVTDWYGNCTDIHDKKTYSEQLEQAVAERTLELLEARDEAIAANEAKSRFLSTVSHEVRTPIAGVIGLVELLFLSTEGEFREMASSALDSCKRLLQILNDLLDASKLQAGAVRLEYRFFAIRPVVGDVVQLISPGAAKKNLEISSVVGKDVPDLVCGDELRVRQVLQNLAFNAIKFTSAGNVRLNIELVRRDDTTTILKISVHDTGIGITPEQQRSIFEPFAQAEASTSRVYGGTGLGLNICRTLAELMGGQIGVTSEHGKGSNFWVIIPFRDNLCSKD